MTTHDLLALARDALLLDDSVSRKALADVMREHGMPEVQAKAVATRCPLRKALSQLAGDYAIELDTFGGYMDGRAYGTDDVEAEALLTGGQEAVGRVYTLAARYAKWRSQKKAILMEGKTNGLAD